MTDELPTKNIDDVPKPFVDVDMKPFELDIYFIFCVLLFNSLFSFFICGKDAETTPTNYLSYAIGFYPKSSSANCPKHETVSKVYLKLLILFLYSWTIFSPFNYFSASTVLISLFDAYNSYSFYSFANGFKS